MSNLILPRSASRTKPQGLAVQTGHPLADRLLWVAAPGASHRLDLVDGGRAPTVGGSGSFSGATEIGDAFTTTSVTGDGLSYPWTDRLLNITTAFTFNVWAKPAADGFSTFLSVPYRSAGWTAPYYAIGLFYDNTQDRLSVLIGYNTSSVDQTQNSGNSSLTALGLGETAMWTVTRADTIVRFFRNGNQIGPDATLPSNAVTDWTNKQPITVLSRSSTSLDEGLQGAVSQAAIWGRALDPSEIKAMVAEPWGFLTPNRKLWFKGAAAPAITGTGASAFGWQTAAVGESPQNYGTGASAWGFSTDALGSETDQIAGTGASQWGWSDAAAGLAGTVGIAASIWGWTPAALGNITVAPYVAEVLSDVPSAYWRLGEPDKDHASWVMALSPVSYWRMNETTGSVAGDETGAHAGTYVAPVTLGSLGAVSSPSNKAVTFGPNGYMVASSILSAATAVSVAFWVNGQNGATNRRIMLDDSGKVSVAFDPTGLAGRLGGTADFNLGTASIMSGWHHVVMTLTAGGVYTCYVDGQPVTTGQPTSHTPITSAQLYIGSAGSSTTDMGLDEVAVWTRALSASEARSMYDGSGNLLDSIGSNHAVSQGSPTRDVTNASIVGDDGGVTFPTTSDFLSTPDVSAVDLGTGPFSIEFWASRTANNTGFQVALSKGAGAYNVGIADGLGNAALDDKLFLGKPGSTILSVSSSSIPADGSIHHYVVTYAAAGAGNTKIYIDGVEGHVDNQPGTALVDNSLPLTFGQESGGSRWTGLLDEVALYKLVLSQARVSAHFAAGHGFTGTGASAWGFATAASGTQTITGTAASSFGWSTAATEGQSLLGTGASAWGWAISSSGTVTGGTLPIGGTHSLRGVKSYSLQTPTATVAAPYGSAQVTAAHVAAGAGGTVRYPLAGSPYNFNFDINSFANQYHQTESAAVIVNGTVNVKRTGITWEGGQVKQFHLPRPTQQAASFTAKNVIVSDSTGYAFWVEGSHNNFRVINCESYNPALDFAHHAYDQGGDGQQDGVLYENCIFITTGTNHSAISGNDGNQTNSIKNFKVWNTYIDAGPRLAGNGFGIEVWFHVLNAAGIGGEVAYCDLRGAGFLISMVRSNKNYIHHNKGTLNSSAANLTSGAYAFYEAGGPNHADVTVQNNLIIGNNGGTFMYHDASSHGGDISQNEVRDVNWFFEGNGPGGGYNVHDNCYTGVTNFIQSNASWGIANTVTNNGPSSGPCAALSFSGNGASAWGFSTAAAGTETFTGTGASAFGWQTAALSFDFSATAASVFGWATAAAGQVAGGTADSIFGWQTAAVGELRFEGTGASSWGWSTEGVGIPPAQVVSGTSDVTFGWLTEATGAWFTPQTILGVGASSWGWSTRTVAEGTSLEQQARDDRRIREFFWGRRW